LEEPLGVLDVVRTFFLYGAMIAGIPGGGGRMEGRK
jgi:hypothetical protein